MFFERLLFDILKLAQDGAYHPNKCQHGSTEEVLARAAAYLQFIRGKE